MVFRNMNFKKGIVLLQCCCILLTLSSGCTIVAEDQKINSNDNETISLDEYSVTVREESLSESNIDYIETEYVHSEDPGTNGFVRKMEAVINGNLSFFFEQTIDLKIRETCIKQTEKLVSLFDADGVYSIYLFEPETMIDAEIRPNEVYTHVQAFESPDYLTLLLLSKYGEYCLYGFAYGYACYLMGIPLESETRSLADNPGLDLNLLCFNDRFMDTDQIENNKEISRQLVHWLVEEKGEEEFLSILQNSGKLEYLDDTIALLKSYYQTKSVSFDPLPAMLCYGGYSFDYALQTKYGLFCIDRRYEDMGLSFGDEPPNPLIYSGFFHKQYNDIREYFIITLEAIYNLSTHFTEIDISDTVVLFDAASGGDTRYMGHPLGGKTTNGRLVHINSVDSVLHEMVHVYCLRSFPMPRERWYAEGLADLLSYSEEKNIYQNEWTVLSMMAILNDDSRGLGDLLRQYLAITDKTAFALPRDIDFWDAYAVYYNQGINDSYESGVSFCRFLIDEYGEESLIEFLSGDEEGNYYDYTIFDGKTREELAADWKATIEAEWHELKTFEE